MLRIQIVRLFVPGRFRVMLQAQADAHRLLECRRHGPHSALMSGEPAAVRLSWRVEKG